RVLADDVDAGLPLLFANSMVTGAAHMLRAAACTVMKPQPHHPRLNRFEAQQIVEVARFRHTQPGSFVLKVSCPVHGLEVRAPALPEQTDAPFVRKTTDTLLRA